MAALFTIYTKAFFLTQVFLTVRSSLTPELKASFIHTGFKVHEPLANHTAMLMSAPEEFVRCLLREHGKESLFAVKGGRGKDLELIFDVSST